MPNRIHRSLCPTAALAVVLAGCGPDGRQGAPDPESTLEAPVALTQRLGEGQALFGVSSGPMTDEQAMVQLHSADFVLYSLESGPFNLDGMVAYLDHLGGSPPLLLRVPPIHTDTAAARDQVEGAMASGAEGIVYPHVTSSEEAALSVQYLGQPWPLGDDGLDVLVVEDREGVANIRAIMATPGLSVVFAGPGNLSRAYDGDIEAVENAIQAVLSACLEFDVICGVTAGADDIEARLDQGFRVIIVTEEEALAIGRRHAGR